MKKYILLPVLFVLIPLSGMTQPNEKDYFYQIPEYPETYTATSVAARMVDGLGFRYYWATDGLTEENLKFKPDPEARSLGETLDHIFGLSVIIANSVQGKANVQPAPESPITFVDKRKRTLQYLRLASEILRSSDPSALENFKVIFVGADGSYRDYPFWNQINGSIADAIWHTGQVVSFRRSAGNPFNNRASMFMGTPREN